MHFLKPDFSSLYIGGSPTFHGGKSYRNRWILPIVMSLGSWYGGVKRIEGGNRFPFLVNAIISLKLCLNQGRSG
jgi:hypothetical protein